MDYLDEVRFLDIEKLKSFSNKEFLELGWVFPCYQYDWVSNEHITKFLIDKNFMANVNPMIDHESDSFLMWLKTVKEEDKHPIRVASIVNNLKTTRKLIKPIEFDTVVLDRCGCSIPNGHHRIRALQYLGIYDMPVTMSGYTYVLDAVFAYCGSNKPSYQLAQFIY